MLCLNGRARADLWWVCQAWCGFPMSLRVCVCVGARQVTLPSSLTLAHLKARVYELSRVAPDRQKLLGLPKTLVDDSLLSVVVSVVGVGWVGCSVVTVGSGPALPAAARVDP